MDSFLMYALLGAVLLFLVFLAVRELMCWYWKINEIVSLQKQILAALTSPMSAVTLPGPSGMRSDTAAQDYASGRITREEFEARRGR